MSWQILKLGKLIGEYPDAWTEAAVRKALAGFRMTYGRGLKLKRNPGKSGRFDRCVADVSARGGVDDPAAVCAAALRRTGWEPRRNAADFVRYSVQSTGKYPSYFDTEREAREYADRKAETTGKRFLVYKHAAGMAKELLYKGINKGKRNPAQSAAALSASFHGRPEESESVIDEAVHVHSHLSDLGGMEEIRLAKGRGKIRFGHDVRLASNEDGSQLFLIGGDQSVDLSAYPELDATKERVVLGRVRSVTYATAKFHLGKSDRRPGPYIHQMGEESGDQPELIYDTVNERLSFVGGHYQVRPEGIVD